ncbi:MAG: SDR family oxidoreductase [Chloroflexi bacterium]|nr:SDR family oxidoreductase [Chloroflexota bacterium]
MLVTNSTGKVGQEIVRALNAAGADYRAATQSLDRAKTVWDFPAPAVYFSYDDPASFSPALQGVTSLFLLHPEDVPERHLQLFVFIDAAIEAGIEEIVFMSALGADLHPTDPLYMVEQHVAQSGARFTILRPNWFMQNFSTQDLRSINTKNEIWMPSGTAHIALIDTRDIAAVAAKLLLDGVESGMEYTLTGSEALTYAEVAARLSALTGRTITHQSPTPEDEIQRMRESNAASEHVSFMEWLFEDIQRGYAAITTNDVQAVLHRQPRTFDQFLHDYAHVWQVKS